MTYCLPTYSARGSTPPPPSSSVRDERMRTRLLHCLLSSGCALVGGLSFSFLVDTEMKTAGGRRVNMQWLGTQCRHRLISRRPSLSDISSGRIHGMAVAKTPSTVQSVLTVD